jgi:hypothetical protein
MIAPRPLTLAQQADLHQQYLRAIQPYLDQLVRIYSVLPMPPLLWNADLERFEPMERELPDWARLSVDAMHEAIQALHAEYRCKDCWGNLEKRQGE